MFHLDDGIEDGFFGKLVITIRYIYYYYFLVDLTSDQTVVVNDLVGNITNT